MKETSYQNMSMPGGMGKVSPEMGQRSYLTGLKHMAPLALMGLAGAAHVQQRLRDAVFERDVADEMDQNVDEMNQNRYNAEANRNFEEYLRAMRAGQQGSPVGRTARVLRGQVYGASSPSVRNERAPRRAVVVRDGDGYPVRGEL